MSNLFKAANTDSARTWNGMKTNSTSQNPVVDLFYKIGSARGKFNTIEDLIAHSFGADKDLAMRVLLWVRDVREGAGERQTFRDAINFLAENEMITVTEASRVMQVVPELGRWDDLKVFVGTVLEDRALSYWVEAIKSGNGLAAKWAPRKGSLASKMRRVADMSPKSYRKLLVANTAVVETLMCAKDWDKINFSHVPSKAASNYQKAFNRNAPDAYSAYKAELVKPVSERDPKVKINASAIFPHDIVRNIRTGDTTVANEQWKALPNFVKNSENAGILPLVDVSASMYSPIDGVGWGMNRATDKTTCMDVAIALGMYLAERNVGIFKDEFITFTASPEFVSLKGNLQNRYLTMSKASWGMNTNVIAALDLIVNSAKKVNLPHEDMPKTLLILSDMQFDRCASFDHSALEAVKHRFNSAGYECPNVVFWNLNSAGSGSPATIHDTGTALVSGFSPSIMKSVLSGTEFTPEAMMMKTIMKERYNW